MNGSIRPTTKIKKLFWFLFKLKNAQTRKDIESIQTNKVNSFVKKIYYSLVYTLKKQEKKPIEKTIIILDPGIAAFDVGNKKIPASIPGFFPSHF